MTLLQLKYFCMACDLHSVTKAAEKLFVTQPTITSAIRELEKEYRLQLLDRRGKGMNLTEKGRLFYQNAAVMLHCADDFDRRMHEMAELRRYVRLGLTKASGSSVYTEYFSYGIMQHPQLDIVTHSGSSSALLSAVREHRLDAIIIPRQEADSLEDVECAKLKTMDMLYCVSKDHRLAKEKAVTVPMILQEPMVSTCDDENKTRVLERLFAVHGATPRIVHRYEQLNLALSLVQVNAASGYFPADSVRGYSGIVGLPLLEEPSFSVYIVWTRESWEKEETRTFIKSIKKFYKDR